MILYIKVHFVVLSISIIVLIPVLIAVIQKTALQTQGCYNFKWYDLDLLYHVTNLGAVTPITCSLACHMAGYKYSGVTVDMVSNTLIRRRSRKQYGRGPSSSCSNWQLEIVYPSRC